MRCAHENWVNVLPTECPTCHSKLTRSTMLINQEDSIPVRICQTCDTAWLQNEFNQLVTMTYKPATVTYQQDALELKVKQDLVNVTANLYHKTIVQIAECIKVFINSSTMLVIFQRACPDMYKKEDLITSKDMAEWITEFRNNLMNETTIGTLLLTSIPVKKKENRFHKFLRIIFRR